MLQEKYLLTIDVDQMMRSIDHCLHAALLGCMIVIHLFFDICYCYCLWSLSARDQLKKQTLNWENKNFFKFINKINLLKFNETTLVFYTRRYYALNHVTRILMSKLQATLFFRGILFEKFPNVAKEIVFFSFFRIVAKEIPLIWNLFFK